MKCQVNLLEEVEVRDTSRVSRKFIAILSVASVVLLLLSTVLFTSWRLNSLEGKLADTAAQIEELKEPYESAVAVKTTAPLNWTYPKS